MTVTIPADTDVIPVIAYPILNDLLNLSIVSLVTEFLSLISTLPKEPQKGNAFGEFSTMLSHPVVDNNRQYSAYF